MFSNDAVQSYLENNADLHEALGVDPGLALHAHHLGSGIHNENYWFEHPATKQKFALRIYVASQIGLTAAQQIDYECKALRWLEPCKRTPIPYYMDPDAPLLHSAVLVSSHVDGSWLDFHQADQLKEAVSILADIHAMPVDERCPITKSRDPLRAQFENCLALYRFYQQAPQVQIPRATAAIDELIARIARALDTAPTAQDARHVQNTEAVPSHFLIPGNGKPGSMVDWEKPVVGEVAQDLAYFMSPTSTSWDTDFIFNAKARERVLDDYWDAVGGRFDCADFEQRYPLYVMVNCLVGLTWYAKAAVDYTGEDKPAGAEKVIRLTNMVFGEAFLQLCRETCFLL